jgi:hypothetical protein
MVPAAWRAHPDALDPYGDWERAPVPPIWMPIELDWRSRTANVAIVNERGSSPLCGPGMENDQFIQHHARAWVVLMMGQPCHGIPISQRWCEPPKFLEARRKPAHAHVSQFVVNPPTTRRQGNQGKNEINIAAI